MSFLIENITIIFFFYIFVWIIEILFVQVFGKFHIKVEIRQFFNPIAKCYTQIKSIYFSVNISKVLIQNLGSNYQYSIYILHLFLLVYCFFGHSSLLICSLVIMLNCWNLQYSFKQDSNTHSISQEISILSSCVCWIMEANENQMEFFSIKNLNLCLNQRHFFIHKRYSL